MDSKKLKALVAYLETRTTTINQNKIESMLIHYKTLDSGVSKEAKTIKSTINYIFDCLYDKNFTDILETIESEKEKNYDSRIRQLETEIVHLKANIEELRDSYWRLKHSNDN